jgi:hypothetical protein
MAEPVERHFQMVDEHESIRRMKSAINVLQEAAIDFTVEGGWAIAAYGSNVASVDLDVLVPGGLTSEVAAAMEEATGYQTFSQATRDALALDFVDADHANPLIDRPLLAYTPSKLLRGNTEIRTIMAGVEAKVPTAPVLVFMKLKAFHDRLIQWRAARGEGYLLGAMTEEERQRTMTLGENHWLRKAGKDLFDASFLLRDHTSLDEVGHIAPADMWSKVSDALRDIPLPLRAFAKAMAKRAKVGDVVIIG